LHFSRGDGRNARSIDRNARSIDRWRAAGLDAWQSWMPSAIS
jgi:hypothetical protein